MKYFVIYDQTSATVITPVPPGANTYEGDKLFLESIPSLPQGHKYIVSNGELTTDLMSQNESDDLAENIMKTQLIAASHSTEELLSAGFDYNGTKFSLDPLSRENWTRLYLMYKVGEFGQTQVPTKDQQQFLLTNSNIVPFFTAFKTSIDSIIEADRQAKLAIINS